MTKLTKILSLSTFLWTIILTFPYAIVFGAQNSIRINVGGPSYIDKNGQVWSADQYFTGNTAVSSISQSITGTPDPILYQTDRYGTDTQYSSNFMHYKFNLTNGSYIVNLKFAEIYYGACRPGARVFSIKMQENPTPVLENFDIYSQASGCYKAIDRSFSVNVSNGLLDIEFVPKTNAPKVNAIEIIPQTIPTPSSTPTPLPTPTTVPCNIQRINAGGQLYTGNNKTWDADKGFTGGQTSSTTHPIENTNDQVLYQTERYNMTGYKFNLPNGVYQVTLKFAEIYCQYSGCRIFTVKIEGNPVLSNFDVFAAAGGSFKAVDKTFNTEVSDGQLNIDFSASKNATKVNAIEIIPVQVLNEGMVSLNFDDGLLSSYLYGVVPILNRPDINLKSTFYIITGTLNNPNNVNGNQILDLLSQGHEIGAHTRTHPHLPRLTPSQAYEEISNSRYDLYPATGIYPTTFAYPYGEYNSTVVNLVKQAGFSSARSVDPGYNSPMTDHFLLRSLGVQADTSYLSVQQWIETAIANKTWLILLFHDINNPSSPYNTPSSVLQSIVNYLKQNNIKVVTMSEGMQIISPQR